ncbi:hypothetical protein V6N11_035005 [Hibiscus sabdariffa]|uniref:F-box domain-containing protein n=2 Tax=Hibiscus sabdariffa TaxID=183260 RepID=A0ABR2A254_9ROSI
MCKKAKHDDRISNLPDSVLSRILSSLPIKDAVSTSILSTRWRHLYAYMLNLDVDVHLFRHFPPRTLNSFMNFMYKQLFLHTEGRIEHFRLHHIIIPGMHDSNVCGWISAVLWRGVKEIDLVFTRSSSYFPLPTVLLFTSKTLVRMKLALPYVMVVPIHVCLPCLKTLVLQIIQFEDGDSVKRLISSCPVLEDLSMFYCNMQNISNLKISNPSLKRLTIEFQWLASTSGIVMDLPNLVYFKYAGFTANNYSMGNMPCLVRADISIYNRSLVRERLSHGHGLAELLLGLGNVKSLRLSIYPEALPNLSHKRFVAFQNLLHLEIFASGMKWEEMGLLEFLEFSYNLQTLVICRLPDEVWFPKGKLVPSCVVYELKEFKVIDFEDESSLFEMVTYILNNATVLEKLTVDRSKLRQVLSLPRCSNKCQVIAF